MQSVGVCTPTKRKGGMHMLRTDDSGEHTLKLLAASHEETWREVLESPLAKKIFRDFNSKYGGEGIELFQDTIIEFYDTVCRYHEKGCRKFAVFGMLKTVARCIEADFILKKQRRKRIATCIPWQTPGKDDGGNNVDKLLTRKYGFNVDWEENLLQQYEARWVRELIKTALNSGIINAKQLKVLWMYYWEEKSDREIALELEENINTVKSRRQRAEEKLRKNLSSIAT